MHHHLPKVKRTWFKITKKGRVLHCMATMAGCVCLAGPAMADFPFPIDNTVVNSTQILNDGQSGTITSTGSIVVIDESGVQINGDDSITLTNAGLISTTGDNYGVYGVDSSSLSNYSSITNSGTITATSPNEYATGILANFLDSSIIDNSGTIEATGLYYATGIASNNTDNNSSISNSGTISATSTDGDASGINTGYMKYNSSVNNSGTISAIADNGWAIGIQSRELEDSSITNGDTGQINVSSNDFAFGIYADSLSGNSTITNAGLLQLNNSGNGATIGIFTFELDDNAAITNSGTIEASSSNENYAYFTTGILAFITSPESVITNDGIIRVETAAGGYFNGGIVSKYGDGTINNSGTITLTQDNPYGYEAAGVLNLIGSPTIVNSGTIQALTTSGAISNENFSVFTPGGSLVNESEGVLEGLLFVGGGVDNQGTISLPTPTSTAFSSGYSGYVGYLYNSGTLGITLYNDDDPDNTQYSILQVAGTAVLLDDSIIHVDVHSASQDQPLMVGQTLEGIIRASSITADLDLLNTTDNSALLKFTPVLSNEDTWLDLNIEQDRTILQATTSAGKKGILGTAGALDELTDSDDPDLNSFIGELFTYETDEEVAQGVAQASPVNATTSPTVANTMFNTMSSVVRARLQSVRGFNSGEQLFSDRNLWVKPLGAHTEQDSRDGINGFSADSYGLGLGADGEYTAGRHLGLAFFYTGADVDSKGVSQDNDLQVFNLMAYGSNPLMDDSTELFYQAGGGLQATDSRRYISAVDETAKADFTAKSLFAQLKGTKTLYPSDKLKTMFGLGLSYMYYYNPSYHEKGAGGLNLDVDSFDSNALVASLEGDLFYDLGSNFRLLASAAVGYDLIDDDTSVTSNFQGDNSVVFATDGIDNSPFIFKLGAGIAKNIQDNLSVDLKYDLDGRSSDYLNHVVTAQLNWKF